MGLVSRKSELRHGILQQPMLQCFNRVVDYDWGIKKTKDTLGGNWVLRLRPWGLIRKGLAPCGLADATPSPTRRPEFGLKSEVKRNQIIHDLLQRHIMIAFHGAFHGVAVHAPSQ